MANSMKRFSLVNILLLSTLWTSGQQVELWPIQKMNWELGFIDKLGKEIYTDKFDILDEEYNSGLVFFKKGKKRGFLDEHGKVVFESKYVWGSFSEGLLKLRDKNGFHYLNTKGEIAIELSSLPLPNGKEISSISNFHDGLALIRIQNVGTEDPNDIASDISFDESVNLFPGNWLFGFINKNGKWAIPPTLESATSFKDGVSLVCHEGRTYFMDTTGAFITKLDYSAIGDYSEGFALVYEDDSCFFINRQGKRIGNLKFKRANKFSEGMASIELNDKWGFIDTSGSIVIEPKYYVRSDFREGLAPVSLKVEEKGFMFDSYFIEAFIDKKGNMISPFQKHVDYAGFKSGLTKGRRFIYTDNRRYTGTFELFYMDKDGNKIWSEVVKQNR